MTEGQVFIKPKRGPDGTRVRAEYSQSAARRNPQRRCVVKHLPRVFSSNIDADLLPRWRVYCEEDVMAQKLTADARKSALGKLSNWSDVKGRDAITRKFTFKDFRGAFAFMTKVAEVAEHMNHHPEWFNVYKTVEVTLSTHDAGGVTNLDIELAQAMDKFAAA
jgi:4a-hydroxytetrahydrobiopterin dehydratase